MGQLVLIAATGQYRGASVPEPRCEPVSRIPFSVTLEARPPRGLRGSILLLSPRLAHACSCAKKNKKNKKQNKTHASPSRTSATKDPRQSKLLAHDHKTAYGRIVRHRRARHDAHTRHTTPETHEKPARNALETHANSYSGGQGPASLQRKKGAEAPEFTQSPLRLTRRETLYSR
jgi:hypothetical protein